MVTAKIMKEGAGMALEITGHAGAGAYGSDLICAATSILAYTAAQGVLELYRTGQLKKQPKVQLLPGICRVGVTEESQPAQVVFFTVEKGLSLLAGKYPKHLHLEIATRSQEKGRNIT